MHFSVLFDELFFSWVPIVEWALEMRLEQPITESIQQSCYRDLWERLFLPSRVDLVQRLSIIDSIDEFAIAAVKVCFYVFGRIIFAINFRHVFVLSA